MSESVHFIRNTCAPPRSLCVPWHGCWPIQFPLLLTGIWLYSRKHIHLNSGVKDWNTARLFFIFPLFNFNFRFCHQLKWVWPLSFDISHHQGVSSCRTVTHMMSFVVVCLFIRSFVLYPILYKLKKNWFIIHYYILYYLLKSQQFLKYPNLPTWCQEPCQSQTLLKKHSWLFCLTWTLTECLALSLHDVIYCVAAQDLLIG